MAPLCHRNHLSFSWSSPPQRQFELSWSPCLRTPGNFKSECRRAVELLYRQTSKELLLLMSGGIDCEIIARCCLELGVPFRAFSYSFQGGSEHDLRWAREFCRKNHIPHEISSFDENQFIQETLPGLAEEFSCPDAYALFEIERFRRIPETFFPIFGNGEPCLSQENPGDGITLSESGSDFVVWQWQKATNRDGCYNFFKFTPELFASYLLDPVSQLWIEQAPQLGLRELAEWKFYLYKKHWPDLEKRQKWTGYERIASAYLKIQSVLQARYFYQGEYDKRNYSNFISGLLGK